MQKNHIFCAVGLLLSVLLTQTAGCTDTKPSETDSEATAAAAVPETEAVTENPALADTLTDADFGGAEFRMMVLGPQHIQIQTFVGAPDGNIVNDAVFGKLKAVEERLNVKIVLTAESLDFKDSPGVLRKQILAGDDSCDIAQGHDVGFGNMSLAGTFINVYDIPHLDFEKLWWMPKTLESMTVEGQMYLIFNNMSYNNIESCRALFFNKGLMDNLGISYPYQEVRDGTWTMDRLLELSAMAYSDLNGNGEKDADDRFGFMSDPYFYCYLEPFDLEPYKKDQNGRLYYDLDLARMSAVTEKFYELIYGPAGMQLKSVKDFNANKPFTENRLLFRYTRLGDAAVVYSGSDVKYGVLPMPKLDETQKEYYGGATDRPFAVPITAEKRLDMIGFVIEALNMEGYRQVYPAYYEVAMKSRYADATDDAEMMDIIHDNVIISFTYLYGDFKSAYNIMLEDLFLSQTPSADVASWAAKREQAQIKRVERLQSFFDEHR